MGQSGSGTKNNIINSAIKVFSYKGYFYTKISDIVKEAGVAQGTFYLYFRNKEECFQEILTQIHNNIVDELDNIDNINDIVIHFIKKVYEMKPIAKIFLFEAVCCGEGFLELYKKFKNDIQNIFRKNIDDDLIVYILSGFLRETIERQIIFNEEKWDEVKNFVNCGLKVILKI